MFRKIATFFYLKSLTAKIIFKSKRIHILTFELLITEIFLNCSYHRQVNSGLNETYKILYFYVIIAERKFNTFTNFLQNSFHIVKWIQCFKSINTI